MDHVKLSPIVDALCEAGEKLSGGRRRDGVRHSFPSRDALIGVVEDLRSILFPGYFGISEVTADSLRFHVGSTLDRVLHVLEQQIQRGYCWNCKKDPQCCPECSDRAADIAREFVNQLPRIARLLGTDVEAAYCGDPAATSADEAIFCYPGIFAITNQRIAHELYRLKVPLIPRMITEHAHSLTGIDIHPGARIGDHFFIDHGTGVVIGETCIIGSNVRLFQGVTLGAKSFPLDEHGNPIKGIDRHPIVEDDVIVYSGATILGRVTIGRGSVIGGNVWLTHSVPPGSKISQSK